MDAVPLSLSLTPHGRLAPARDAEAPSLESGLQDRLLPAFERGSGHGLLLLGADEAGTALPPVYSYWREFGVRHAAKRISFFASSARPAQPSALPCRS